MGYIITMCKVSVVSPIFNSEKYLKECLDSLVNQTLTDLQIICIDDGSTDRSLEIVNEYAERDTRIEIVSKPNGGYGSAMNKGIRRAKGKYFAILEPDDFIKLDAYEKLYEIAEKFRVEIIKCNQLDFSTQKGSKFRNVFGKYTCGEVFDPHTYKKAILSPPMTCSGLFLRDLIVRNGIWYNETPGASFQDTAFSLKCWLCSKRAIFLEDAYYYYRRDNESSSLHAVGKVFCVCDEFNSVEAFLNELPDDQSDMIPVLWAKRFRTYAWNYKRISWVYKFIFLLKWSEEFRFAASEGFLDKKYYSEKQWYWLTELIHDPESLFAEKEISEYELWLDREHKKAAKQATGLLKSTASWKIGRIATKFPRMVRDGWTKVVGE